MGEVVHEIAARAAGVAAGNLDSTNSMGQHSVIPSCSVLPFLRSIGGALLAFALSNGGSAATAVPVAPASPVAATAVAVPAPVTPRAPAPATAAATPAATPAPVVANAPAAAPGPRFSPRATEVLRLLEKEDVLTLETPAGDERLVQALLGMAGGGARILPKSATPGASAEAPATGEPVLLKQRFWYLPVHLLSAAAKTGVEKTLAGAKGKSCDGLILDLRDAKGGHIDAVRGIMTVLGAAQLPLVILIGGDTVGAPEVLAVLARQKLGATLVGQRTHGLYASLEPFALSTGDRVLLPHRLADVDGVPMPKDSLTPDLAIAASPAPELLTGLTSERFDALPDKDPALVRAVDLLTAVAAFNHRRF